MDEWVRGVSGKPLFLNSGLGKIEVINHWISIQYATDKKKRARAHLVARALFFFA
jgi:hypothetical protein